MGYIFSTELSMTTLYTRRAFEALYQELFQQVTQREWVIAASLAAECNSYINSAFGAGYRDIANACLQRLDDLVNPVYTSEYRQTGGYNGLWKLPEMKAFIAKHLEYVPEQAVDLAKGISAANAKVMVEGLVRRGVMDRTGVEDDGDSDPSLTAKYTIDLVHLLLDQHHDQAAVSLIDGLINAERIETSDFFVDENFARAITRLDGRGFDTNVLLAAWQDPLIHVSSVSRKCGYGHIPAKIKDVQRIAEMGAPQLAKYMLRHGSYCAEPLDLCALEASIGEPFTREDILMIGSHRDGNVAISAIWLGSALKYWLNHQEMAWPFAHEYNEGSRFRLARSPSACHTINDIPDEAASQGQVIKSVFDAHGFDSKAEHDRMLVEVLKLYFQGHEVDELQPCYDGLIRALPKNIVLSAAGHQVREKEFGADLGL